MAINFNAFATLIKDWQLNVRQTCCHKKELQWLEEQYVSHEANKTTIEFHKLPTPKHDIQPQRRIVKLCVASWVTKRLMNHKKKMQKLVIEWLVSGHDAQSKSQKPFSCKGESLGKKSPGPGLVLR